MEEQYECTFKTLETTVCICNLQLLNNNYSNNDDDDDDDDDKTLFAGHL